MDPTQSEAITIAPLTKMNVHVDVAPHGFIGTMIDGAGAVTPLVSFVTLLDVETFGGPLVANLLHP